MSLEQDLQLLRKAANSAPDPAQSDDVFGLLGQGEPYTRLFFLNLAHPGWLAILRERGYFNNIPAPGQNDDGSTTFRPHFPLIALENLASVAPVEVAKILSELPETENITVGDQIMRCMVAIKDPAPTKQLLPVAKRLVAGGDRSTRLYLRDLLVLWMGLGRIDETLALMDEYVRSIVLREATLDRDRGTAWELQECDTEVLRPLAESDPMPVSNLCFQNLCAFAEASKEADAKRTPPDPNDLFAEPVYEGYPPTYWLEDLHESSSGIARPAEILVHRLFEAAIQTYAEGNNEEREQLDRLLRSHEWELFRRLRWQAYADCPEVTLRWARSDVAALIHEMGQYDQSHDFEFASMLKAHSDCHGTEFLNPDEVIEFIAAVRAGPITGDDEPELLPKRQERFHYRQLWPLRAILPEDERAFLDRIASERNDPRRPEFDLGDYKPFRSYGFSQIEEKSPFSQLDLAALDNETLWEKLNNWDPKNLPHPFEGWVEETPRRLADQFCKLLDAAPDRFPATTRWWEKIRRPAILSRVMEHWTPERHSQTESLEASQKINWDSALGISQYIVSRRPVVTQEDDSKADEGSAKYPDWGTARMAVARFISGTLSEIQVLPPASQDVIRSVLEDLVTAADPRLDHLNTEKSRDWQFDAINSVRGTATEAALGVAHTLKIAPNVSYDLVENWITTLLGIRLKPETNESPAFFALLGSRLRFCAFLFPQWLRDHQSQIFPEDRPVHRTAALRSHFFYDGPSKALIDTIPELPRIALDELEAWTKESADEEEVSMSNERDITSRIGYHISFYLWNGLIEPGKAQSLLERYYNLASPSARGEVIGFIGSVFEKIELGSENPEIFQRAITLLDQRLESIVAKIKAHPEAIEHHRSELGQFADLVAAECFDFDWRVETAVTALELLKGSPRSFQLLGTIENWSSDPKRLPAATNLLYVLTSNFSKELRWSVQPKRVRAIIREGLAHNDLAVRENAAKARENLLREGFFDLLELSEQ